MTEEQFLAALEQYKENTCSILKVFGRYAVPTEDGLVQVCEPFFVGGSVDLTGSSKQIELMPYTIIEGGLYASHAAISKIPHHTWIKGHVELIGSNLQEIEDHVRIEGDLRVPEDIKPIPESVRVKGEIFIGSYGRAHSSVASANAFLTRDKSKSYLSIEYSQLAV